MTAAEIVWRYCLEFGKDGPARFVSHLDLQEAFERALRRARLPLAFSRGFHPRPRMQFEDPLPLGWASDRERVWLDLAERYPAAEALLRLRANAPPGVEVQRLYLMQGRPMPPPARRYRVSGIAMPAPEALREFASQDPDALAPVTCTHCGDALEFTLRPNGKRPAPSLKKVLRAIAGETLPEGCTVRRLAWEPGTDLGMKGALDVRAEIGS